MPGSSRVPFTVRRSAAIAAPAERLYGIIADYRQGHPTILPKPFSNLVVEEGGVGAGTIIRFTMRVMGRTHTYRAVITEPEPGRILVERNVGSAASVTTFIVEPTDGRRSRVKISTEIDVRSGMMGALERFMTRRFLEPIYAAELQLLATRAGDSRNA